MARKAGDIYVKVAYNKDPVSHLIRAGQAITGGTRHANYVHAGIGVDADSLVESQGEGVVINNINENLQHGYKYKCFRFLGSQQTVDLAVDFALEQAKRSPDYNIAKAGRSLFGKKSSENVEKRGLLGKETYFCSELVVDCYANADESLFDGEKSRNWNPSKLYTYLKANSHAWENLGHAYEVY